jgi:hypothetical protein
MQNNDDHPLRHRLLTLAIEQLLFKREIQRRLDGHTRETSIEIAELVEKSTNDEIKMLREAIDLVRALCVRLTERLDQSRSLDSVEITGAALLHYVLLQRRPNQRLIVTWPANQIVLWTELHGLR